MAGDTSVLRPAFEKLDGECRRVAELAVDLIGALASS